MIALSRKNTPASTPSSHLEDKSFSLSLPLRGHSNAWYSLSPKMPNVVSTKRTLSKDSEASKVIFWEFNHRMLPLRLGLNVISHITALSCMGVKLNCSSPENKTFCTRLAFCGAVLNDLVWQTRFVWWNLGSWWTLHVITVLRRTEWKLLLVIFCCYWLDCTFEDCELVIVFS